MVNFNKEWIDIAKHIIIDGSKNSLIFLKILNLKIF